MGILEKTRALLVSKLGPRIADSSADSKALRELILELERARADIVRGLENLNNEVQWLSTSLQSEKNEAQLRKVRADIEEGKVELERVIRGIEDAKAALAALAKRKDSAAPGQ